MDMSSDDRDVGHERALEGALRRTRHALLQTVHAISAVAGHRDQYTARHHRLAASLALATGRRVRFNGHQLEGVYLGALSCRYRQYRYSKRALEKSQARFPPTHLKERIVR